RARRTPSASRLLTWRTPACRRPLRKTGLGQGAPDQRVFGIDRGIGEQAGEQVGVAATGLVPPCELRQLLLSPVDAATARIQRCELGGAEGQRERNRQAVELFEHG